MKFERMIWMLFLPTPTVGIFNILFIDAILPRKGPVTRAMSKRLKEDWARAVEEGPRVLMNLRVDFLAHGPRLGPIIFVHIRLGCHYI